MQEMGVSTSRRILRYPVEYQNKVLLLPSGTGLLEMLYDYLGQRIELFPLEFQNMGRDLVAGSREIPVGLCSGRGLPGYRKTAI
jgi:hypothetical protein